MNKYPKYAKLHDKTYKINTDFRVSLKCHEVINSEINAMERTLAVIYLLFGEDGLNNNEDWERIVKNSN